MSYPVSSQDNLPSQKNVRNRPRFCRQYVCSAKSIQAACQMAIFVQRVPSHVRFISIVAAQIPAIDEDVTTLRVNVNVIADSTAQLLNSRRRI